MRHNSSHSDAPCKECKKSYLIQNKTKHLCGDCVFRISHGGKTQVEVYQERAKKRQQIKDSLQKKKDYNKARLIPMNKRSDKEVIIQQKYALALMDIDYIREKVCSGCLRYQGGDVRLSHSHIISRADCKAIGKPELIYDPDNIAYHCLDFGEHKGCHPKWENKTKRYFLTDYGWNIIYIRKVAPELYEKYLADHSVDN